MSFLAPVSRPWWLFFSVVFLAACSDDPVSYSAPVGINLKAKGDDVKNGVVVDEKNITTESGNPYGAFVSEARKRLGREPGRIEVSSASLLLGATSKGVTTLEQVLTGRVDLQFVMNDTNNTFLVGHLMGPTGPGPRAFTVDFAPSGLQGADWQKLLGGSFKVVLRGTAVSSFVGAKDTEADMQVTLQFAAFE